MPVFVDGILTCVRIRELIGECYELCPITSTASDEEVSTNYGDNFIVDQEAVLGDENATEEDGNSEDDDESHDDDSDEDLFNNVYLDGGDEQSCGVSEFAEKVNSTFPVTFKNDNNLSPNNTLGNIDKVELDVVVEDSLINDKSHSTNKVGNQVNNEGLVAVSAFPLWFSILTS